MSVIMIAGSQQNLVERKHIDKLRSSLFAGGCEKIIIENNKYLLNLFKSPLATYSQFKLTDDIEESPFDREFLMSVYNNTNEGSQLISKIKEHMKDRQRLVHKSIEQQVNDAFAAVFAVYIKHYRRINLAKHELAQTDNKRPHHKLLSLYEYANHVQTLFATTKAQGGDCNELYKQIKTNALFLLSSVQSGNSVPIINEDLLQSTTSTHIMTTVEYKIKPSFKRQVSRWTTAKRVLQLLRNTMNACIRFKKLMLAKKQAIRQKLDNESILNRTIDAYIYGDPYKTITSEEKSLESDELIQCMSRHHNQLILNALSTNVLKYNGWKPYASQIEIESFRRGRIGSNELSVVPMPLDISDLSVFEECGNNHKFKGRISPSRKNTNGPFPTYIVDNIQVSEGKWYYCVKILVNNYIQIGWATSEFVPQPDDARGIGDDKYSWSYDGSRGTLYNNGEFHFTSDDIRWKENDVCGCGIEIDGENICIKYWLNGNYLGKGFEHQSNIASTTTICNMLPNGRQGTIYFPGVSLQVSSYSSSRCELIFSPEDMTECPLPKGYKPLLMPKLINVENSIVAYPYSAYLIDDQIQNNFHTQRSTTPTTFLRDFVSEDHLETEFTIDNNQLVLPENSNGLPLSIDNHASSLTISFDFKTLKKVENDANTKLDILLFTLETIEIFSVQISISKIENEIRTAIIVNPNEQQMIIYFNNECRKFHIAFETSTMAKLNFHILPNIAVGIKNLGIWKYALSEEHIQRLFTYGLFYVAIDYQQLKEHRTQANTITFSKNQQQFSSQLLIPFNEPFEKNIWEKKKKQVDIDESIYFRTIAGTDESVVQLFGNKTYLVLDKSADQGCEYALILDICIPNWPTNNEQLTLLRLNTQSEIYITHNGKIVLSSNAIQNKSDSTLKLNEYFRLHISFQKKVVKIYVNGILELSVNVNEDQFMAKAKRIELFREVDLGKNTTNDDRLRIECKSITFLNDLIADADNREEMKSTKYSLETLVAPPFSIVALNLVAIGYKESWIKYAMKEYNTSNIQWIDTIIREKKEEFMKNEAQNRQKRYFNILSRLNPSIDREKMEDLLAFSKFDTDEQVTAAYKLVLLHCHDLQTSKSLLKTYETKENVLNFSENETSLSSEKWYYQTIRGLDVNDHLDEWIQGKTTMIRAEDLTCQLFDLTKSEQELTTMTSFAGSQQKKIKKSIQYSHRQISQQKYMNLRVACEHGLTMMYARYTVCNMLKLWSPYSSNKFPWEKFGDCALITRLLRYLMQAKISI
ncbi:unnamed protein product [Rotaria sp. Silwood1]|nr:unnamed protein product [Rotaria sp. Silwood1]